MVADPGLPQQLTNPQPIPGHLPPDRVNVSLLLVSTPRHIVLSTTTHTFPISLRSDDEHDEGGVPGSPQGVPDGAHGSSTTGVERQEHGEHQSAHRVHEEQGP